jgi:hypothetical protein
LQWHRHGGDDVIDALRMQITTKPLKLRRQKNRVGVVDLLGGVTTSSFSATDPRMCRFNLIERIDAFAPPPRQ